MILGASAELSEAEPHWRSFLASLKERGMGIPDSITSDAHEGLTVFSLPEHKRKRLRKLDMCETLNTQIKRRTKVAGLFPNTDSILRLVTAILMEFSEEWEAGKAYINIRKA